MYKLTNVTKSYSVGRNVVGALQGVNLTISDGEWLAIQGPTGHGKSTLLQMLGALDRPTSGSVEFDGKDLAELREADVGRIRATSFGFILPDLQPDPHAERTGERRDGARAARNRSQRAAGQGGGRARRCRAGRAQTAPAIGAIGWSAAARRHRQGAGEPAGDSSGG